MFKYKISEKKLLQSLIIFSIFLIFLLSLVGDKGFFQHQALKAQENRLLEEIDQLKNEKREWQAKVKALKNEPGYFETMAREQLGMVRKDEIIIHLEYSE